MDDSNLADPHQPIPDLWPRARAATARALAQGALQPQPTEPVWWEENGRAFLIHLATGPDTLPSSPPYGPRANPFLPPEPELFVADLTPTHICLLNKYPVFPHHLLLVTRRFEPQTAWLSAADFAALATGLAQIDGLGFYNAGPVAGASQPHKHLQIVPLPLAAGGPPLPLAPLVNTAVGSGPVQQAEALPFPHAITHWAAADAAVLDEWAARLHRRYHTLMQAIGLRPQSPPRPLPHNLLVTRRWMMVVPRRRARFGHIAVNALGFAGSLLARNTAEFATIRATGVLNLLRQVA